MTVLERFRQPEYTGENRCLPCTAVNAVIAVALAGVVGAGVATLWTSASGGVAALLVLAVSAAAIWLRGYLVPGTPTLTKRHMPPWMLAWFGKGPAAGGESFPDQVQDVEGMLRDAGVLEPCEDVDDLCLTPEFDRELRDAFEETPEEPEVESLVAALGIDLDAEDLAIKEYDDAVMLRRRGGKIGTWPSATAIQVEVAAAEVLADWIPGWAEATPQQRSQLLAGVRLFLEECPDGDSVEMNAETVESCCSSYEVVTLVCAESGDRLLEQEVP